MMMNRLHGLPLIAALWAVGCASTQGHQTPSTAGAQTAECARAATSHATTPPTTGSFEEDRAAILAMAGEYRVQFQFKETVALRDGYTLTKPYLSAAKEIVEVIEDSGTRIDLQHILLTGPMVIKHWRQTWTYEPTTLYEFKGHRTWTPRTISPEEAKGKWSQYVTQVDDSPRYSGLGPWTHTDNLSSWEADGWRPLPRREYTKRDDYHVLVARNRHTITPTGWVHEQDNYKRVLGESSHPLIAREVGLNVYTKTTEVDFTRARTYWSDTTAFWAKVREAWTGLLDGKRTIQLAAKWDDKPMYYHLFTLANAWREDPEKHAEILTQLGVVLEGFMVTGDADQGGY